MRDEWVQSSEHLRTLIAEAKALAPTVLSDEEVTQLLAFVDGLGDANAEWLADKVPGGVPVKGQVNPEKDR